MSIINDALKKLQNEISHSHNKPANAQAPLTAAQQAGFQPVPSPETQSAMSSEVTELQPPTPLPAKVKESSLVYILGVLCLMIGLFAPIVNKQSVIGMLIERLPKHSKISLPHPKVRTAAPAPAKEKRQETPRSLIDNIKSMASPKPAAAPSSSRSRIIVNGIMARGKQNLALIDGQVYEQGEEVDGVKIIKINPNSIVVLEDGVERTVKVAGY